MSDLGNKEIMAKNIRFYMDLNNISQTDICNILNFKMSTFSDWLHAKTYPRIDKIELMANYFGIEKSDLVENRDRKKLEEPVKQPQKDIEKILSQTKEQLTTQEGLMFDGKPASPESIDSILAAMKIGMELAREKNKEKYTPKKYKKD